MTVNRSPDSLKKGSHRSTPLFQEAGSLKTSNIRTLTLKRRATKVRQMLGTTNTIRKSTGETFRNASCGNNHKVYNLKTVGAVIERLCAWREIAAKQLACLTDQQFQIMELVLSGSSSKNIATDLGISRRTVENHRALVMKKTGSKSLRALGRLALAASWDNPDTSIP